MTDDQIDQTQREPSAEAQIAADKIQSLDVFTFDKWTERRELTTNARRVIAFALDAFAAQAVAADRAQRDDRINEALAKPIWLKEKPSREVQAIRSALCVSYLLDIAAQRGITSMTQRRPLSEANAKRLAEIDAHMATWGADGSRCDRDPYEECTLTFDEVRFLRSLLDASDQRAAAVEECARWHDETALRCSAKADDPNQSRGGRSSLKGLAAWHAECAEHLRALLRPADREG